ncbi:MAG TPA: TraR/DksA C4-type zinc finger protein [Armatimonadota bacterium]|jgi:RNA polymerase-binding protein DksA
MSRHKRDLSAVRESLLAERQRLQEEVAGLDERSVGSQLEETGELTAYDNHPADVATSTFERERDLTLERNLVDVLQRIDVALERVEAGTYGACAECGKPIPAPRLEALPWANYCLDCQARVEAA